MAPRRKRWTGEPGKDGVLKAVLKEFIEQQDRREIADPFILQPPWWDEDEGWYGPENTNARYAEYKRYRESRAGGSLWDEAEDRPVVVVPAKQQPAMELSEFMDKHGADVPEHEMMAYLTVVRDGLTYAEAELALAQKGIVVAAAELRHAIYRLRLRASGTLPSRRSQ